MDLFVASTSAPINKALLVLAASMPSDIRLVVSVRSENIYFASFTFPKFPVYLERLVVTYFIAGIKEKSDKKT